MEPWRIIVYLISNFLSLSIILAGLYMQLGRPYRVVLLVVYSALYFSAVCIAIIIFESPLVVMFTNLACISLMTTCYPREKTIERIAIPILMYVTFLLMEGVGILVSSVFSFSNEAAAFIIRHTVIKVIVLASLQMISRFKYIKDGHGYFSLINTLILVAIPIGSVVIIVLDVYNIEGRTMQSLAILLILSIINVLVYVLYNTMSNFYIELNEAREVEQQNKYYKKQLVEINKHQERISMLHHDLKNCLLPITGYLKEGNTSRASDSLEKLIDEKLSPSAYCETGNIAVDSVMNYKLQELEAFNPQMEIETKLPSHIGFEDYDISLVLGNLLDNVYDAFTRLDAGVDIILRCILSFDHRVFRIHLENTFDGIIDRKRDGLVTRKENAESHGIGMPSIEATLRKYDGEYTYRINGALFIVDIIMFENVELL